MKAHYRDNALLGRITFITSLGDWLTYFALMHLAYQSSGSLVIATLSLTMRSIAIATSAVLTPWLMGKLRLSSLVITSQWLSFFAVGGLTVAVIQGAVVSTPVSYSAFFLLTLFKQVFDTSRESLSKMLPAEDAEQRSLQAELLTGLFSAQMVGPLLALVLLLKLPVWIALGFDSVSFLAAGLLALRLNRSPSQRNRVSILRVLKPLGYLWKAPELRDIVLLRSVGFWVPCGIYNILLFQIFEKHFDQPAVFTAVAYAFLGAGAFVASFVLRNRLTKLSQITDGQLAAFGQTLYAATSFLLIKVSLLPVALSVTFVTGLAMGMNSVATQSLRRRLSSNDRLPEIINFEVLVGRATDAIVMTAIGLALKNGNITYQQGTLVACTGFCLSALLHLRFREPLQPKSIS